MEAVGRVAIPRDLDKPHVGVAELSKRENARRKKRKAVGGIGSSLRSTMLRTAATKAAQRPFPLVPASMLHLQRSDIIYLAIVEDAISPVILSLRNSDRSEGAALFRTIGSAVFGELAG